MEELLKVSTSQRESLDEFVLISQDKSGEVTAKLLVDGMSQGFLKCKVKEKNNVAIILGFVIMNPGLGYGTKLVSEFLSMYERYKITGYSTKEQKKFWEKLGAKFKDEKRMSLFEIEKNGEQTS